METLQRTANRGSISTGYDIDNSLKFEADNSEYLNRTSGANGSRTTWTTSVWVKRTELGVNQVVFSSVNSSSQANFYRFLDSDKIRFYFQPDDVAVTYYADTNAVFRDTSAWYHIVWGLDSTNSDGSKRFVVYVNGVYQDSTWGGSATASINCPQNSGSRFLQSEPIQIGRGTYGADHYFSGYMAELHVLDGIAPDPTDFGEFDEDSGIWKPKAYTGSYGTNGFYLDFESSGSLGADSSSNGNNFTPTNITSADQATDTPTNNFAIPNVIGTTRTNVFTYTEGGTKVIHQGGSDWNSWANTIAVGSGKWYAEFKIIGGNSHFVGVGSEDYYFVGAGSGTGWPEIYYGYSGTNSVGYHNTNGDIYNNGTQVVIGTTYTTNDIISVALDMDNGKVYFAKNGTYINSQNPVTGTNAQNLPDTSARYFIGTSHYTSSIGAECNFGGYTSFSIASGNSDSSGYGTFEYAPPSGYYALCTKNLAEYG